MMNMWNEKYINELVAMRKKAQAGGGESRKEKQHASDKLTAWERCKLLFDKDSFVEIESLMESREFEDHTPGDGVIVGYGQINGRTVFASIEDFTVKGGTLGEYHSKKICRIMDLAIKACAPYICINDSGVRKLRG